MKGWNRSKWNKQSHHEHSINHYYTCVYQLRKCLCDAVLQITNINNGKERGTKINIHHNLWLILRSFYKKKTVNLWLKRILSYLKSLTVFRNLNCLLPFLAIFIFKFYNGFVNFKFKNRNGFWDSDGLS